MITALTGMTTALMGAFSCLHCIDSCLHCVDGTCIFCGCAPQGMDFYVAACAPTIVTVIATLPIQGSYAYIKNARDNHAPLPAVTYRCLTYGRE